LFSDTDKSKIDTITNENGTAFKEAVMGTIEVSQQVIGEPSTKVLLQATAIDGDALPEIASITLVPVQE